MTKPNFVFILIDDMGWRDLTSYGSTFYETPNIDTLARDGMLFTDAYAACPVCSPTRASIMTGKYPARLGLTDYIGGSTKGKLLPPPYIRYLAIEETTIARALKDGGYQTFHVGKWHLGSEQYWPERHGFDVNVGGCDWGSPKHGYFSPYGNPRLKDGPFGEYLTDRLTSEAITLLKERGHEPFFMYLAYYAVHIPIQVPKRYVDKYKAKAEKLGLVKQKATQRGEYFPTVGRQFLRLKRRVIQSDPGYAGMVENLDENVGRVLQAIEDIGRAKDTVVIFTSDNGGLSTTESSPTCNAPLAEGKGWMYEGGTRDPLLVKWPGHVKARSTCTIPITSTDFYPTLLEMAGMKLMPEQHRDGTSMMPLLKGESPAERDAIFWHYPHYGNQGGTPGTSIRAGDYKLIEFHEDARLELYNLKNDIGEHKDLSKDQPDIAAQLKERLDAWRVDVGAKAPTLNPAYKRGLRRFFSR
nr:sulfatase [Candidatus Sigynarchaeota archaeon]